MKVNMLGFVFRMLLEDIRKIKPTNKHFVFTPEEAQQVIRMLGLLSFGMNKSFEVGIYSKNQVTLQAYSGYGFHGEVNINKDCLQTFPIINKTNLPISEHLREIMKDEFKNH